MPLTARHFKQAAATVVAAGLLTSAVSANALEAPKDLVVKANFIKSIGFVEDDGASEHMEFATKLRTLSQRIPASACFEHFGIEKDVNAELLRVKTIFFDRILKGLEFGDTELGLMKEERDPAILRDLASIHEIWDPQHDLIEKIASGNSTDDDIILLGQKGKKLVDLTTRLSANVSAEYSDPTVLLQADAIVLEIAGRMPMMAQRMAKDLCLVLGKLAVQESLDELAETRTLFENTLDALQNGMPAMGLKATKDASILAELASAQSDWNAMSVTFDALQNGEFLDKEQETQVFYAISALTDRLDKIEHMYAEASKLDL